MRFIMLILCLLLVSSNSYAYFQDGNDLVGDMREWKNANNKSPNTNYTAATGYSSYVRAIYDVLELNKIICTSNNTTVGQVNAVVAKFLDANPERWSEPAYFLVSDALKPVFPCGK
ncbi:MAG: Rap1a/Tai family immunity protein [Salinivirgaceae bacterium]|nr:Rap1a/Tai family immunity protein [Salinivirgaceae bacterium]